MSSNHKSRDDIIDFWSRVQADDFYRDGVITYKAPRRHFGTAFRRLSRELGIKTKPARRKKADIFCEWGDPGNGWAGVHHDSMTKKGRPQSHVVVLQGKFFTQSTVIHEIGHALGLNHPEDHSRDDTIMSYGAPDTLPWFTKLDRMVLEELYG